MMKLNVSQLDRGQESAFSFAVSAEKMDIVSDSCTFTGEIITKGMIVNTGRVYRLEGTINCQRSFICDRCLSESVENAEYPFVEEYKQAGDSSADDDKVTVFNGDSIDIVPLVRDTILAAQPIRNLCRPDCLGLCLKCGADLNKGDCGCDRRVVDPRLAALQDFISK